MDNNADNNAVIDDDTAQRICCFAFQLFSGKLEVQNEPLNVLGSNLIAFLETIQIQNEQLKAALTSAKHGLFAASLKKLNFFALQFDKDFTPTFFAVTKFEEQSLATKIRIMGLFQEQNFFSDPKVNSELLMKYCEKAFKDLVGTVVVQNAIKYRNEETWAIFWTGRKEQSRLILQEVQNIRKVLIAQLHENDAFQLFDATTKEAILWSDLKDISVDSSVTNQPTPRALSASSLPRFLLVVIIALLAYWVRSLHFELAETRAMVVHHHVHHQVAMEAFGKTREIIFQDNPSVWVTTFPTGPFTMEAGQFQVALSGAPGDKPFFQGRVKLMQKVSKLGEVERWEEHEGTKATVRPYSEGVHFGASFSTGHESVLQVFPLYNRFPNTQYRLELERSTIGNGNRDATNLHGLSLRYYQIGYSP